MTSILSAFPFIGEQSFATPGAFNSPLSILSANIAAINADVGAISGVTISPPSGNTITIASNLSVTGQLQTGPLHTDGPIRIDANSNLTNYLYLSDASNLRSDYIIGSQVGGTADGLNIWDDSGQTMIVSFSKQSIRFFQQVVGPVFDVGGALASTLNAATFGGSLITTQIQGAISAATLAVPKIKRVYVPASMYPYDPRQLSFDTNVQMVREGGAYDVYDIQAYGAINSLAVADDWSTTAMQAAIHAAHGSGGGVVYVPTGQYAVSGISSFRDVIIRGSGGGRFLSSAPVAILYQASAATTIVILADQGGSGAVIEDVQLSASGNVNNQGGILIAGMTFCLIRATEISGTSRFAVRVIGGNDAVLNVIEGCAITMTSVGTAIDVQGGPSGMDSSPYVTGCFVSCDAPTAWISVKSTSSGVAPDSPLFTNNRFITTSTATALYGQMTNARFIGNRFEAIGGGLNITLAPPTGSQPAGVFIGNSYGITGGSLVWTDSATTPSARFQELTPTGIINSVPGSAALPSYAFGSELSLGFYRSGSSTIGLSYGALAYPSGSATTPSITFSSETSLGFYRSGASSVGLSYGTFVLPLGSQLNLIGAGGTPIPLRIFESGDVFSITANRNRAGNQDNAAAASWEVDFNVNAGTGDGIDYIHNPAGGGGTLVASLRSAGEWQIGAGVALLPGIGFKSEQSLGLYRSGVSTLALSYGTLNLATQAVRLSMRTLAASSVTASAAKTNVAVNEVVFTLGGASGASLIVYSGGTAYGFNSAFSAAAS